MYFKSQTEESTQKIIDTENEQTERIREIRFRLSFEAKNIYWYRADYSSQILEKNRH